MSKANPHTFIYMNPLSRNPGSAMMMHLVSIMILLQHLSKNQPPMLFQLNAVVIKFDLTLM